VRAEKEKGKAGKETGIVWGIAGRKNQGKAEGELAKERMGGPFTAYNLGNCVAETKKASLTERM